MTVPTATTKVSRKNRLRQAPGSVTAPLRTSQRSRPSSIAVTGTVMLLVGILVLVGGTSLIAPPSRSNGMTHTHGLAAGTSSTDLLRQAHAAAARGQGPGEVPAPRAMSHPSAGPNVSFGVVMTYDAADGYVLAVSLNVSTSGYNSSYGPTELTWKFAGGNWSLVATTGQVPATLSPGLVYDGHDQYVLLYGGRLMGTPAPWAPVTNQTWSYLGGTWTNLSANNTAAPFAVTFSNLVYDAVDQYVVLYDELDNSPGNLQSTWSYAGGIWTNLTATAGTPPVFLGAMTYDALDKYVVYFGGYTNTNQLTNATWTFSAGTWTNVTSTVTGAPSPRMNFGITYDSIHQQVLLYGGDIHLYVYNSSAFSYEMWAYASGSWTLLSSNGSTYSTQSMVFDVAANETLLIGSSNLTVSPPNVITWEFTGGNWAVAAPIIAPGARTTDTGHAFTLVVTQSPNAGGLSYYYSGLPSGCSTVNAPTLTCVPMSSGTYVVMVKITGAAGFVASTRTVVRVNAVPAVLDFAPTATTGEVGLGLGFDVTAAYGSGSLTYSYLGLPSGCASVNTPHLSCVPAAAGSYDLTASVTDAVGVTAQGFAHLQVVPALAVAGLTADHPVLDFGQSVTVVATLDGGAGPFGYAYTGLPSGCMTTDLSALSCQVSAVGSFSIGVSATDGLGGSAHGSLALTVNRLPTVESLVPSNSSILAGGSVQLATTISGGTSPFEFRYAGLPSGCAGTGGAVVTCSAIPKGSYAVSVTVIDATGAAATGKGTFSVVTEGPKVGSAGGLGGAGFLWGFAVGAIAIAVAGVVGGYRLLLARQGEEIVRGLRTRQGDSPSDATGDPDNGSGPDSQDR